MKRRLFVGLAILAVLAATVCIMASCSEKNTDDTPGGEIPEATELRTVEIICGENRTLRAYELGTEIKLKAEIAADEMFVCWLAEGKPFSYDRETVYKVTSDAVVRAVYASAGAVTLDADGGTLPENYVIKVSAYGGILSDTDGALLKGYGYILPVPEKYRFGFVGWQAGETLVTDANGTSTGVYEGGETVFHAVYKENPFVNIVLKNAETGEVTEEIKAYIEDGAVRITALDIVDRQCTGWKLNGASIADEGEFIFSLTGDNVVSGETYVLEAQYREAYKLTVIGGSGGGFYARTDTIDVSGTVPAGSNFVEWRINYGGTQYVLGRTSDGTLCFINGGEATYFSAEENRAVTLPVAEVGAEKSPITETFTLAEIERTGAVISGGANTLLKAEFIRKEHTVFYRIDCNVNGEYCLDAEGENRLIGAGFEKSATEEGVFLKEEYYDYNNAVVLAAVPAISHYKFGNWENADNSGRIPSVMPDGDVYVRGTFVPETHKISVKSDESDKGTAKIGASGTLSGYYEYGQTIEIYVVAESGYKFGQWLDKENNDASGRVIQYGDEVKTDTIYYVYRYRVEQEESFTVRFIERDYTITYILSVVYDGNDVTDDPAFFENGAYTEGYNVTSETRNYGVRGGLKPKVEIKGDATPDGLALIYGAANWTVSDWKADREGLGDLNDFVMPKYDVVVRSVCTINSYSVGFSAQEGVGTYEVSAINGKDPSLYASGSVYVVPFGSAFDVDVTVDNGYRMHNVRVGGEAIGEESGYGITNTGEYESEINFVFIKSGKSTIYVIYAERNIHTVKYYVSADYLHADADRLLSGYIAVDTGDKKTVGDLDYYLVTGVLAPDGSMKDVTAYDMVYGQQIEDPTIDATERRYSFGGWTRMSGDKPYNENVMPDGSVWAYGRFTLQSYTVSVAKNTFRFDEGAGNVETANVNKIVEREEETVYGESNPFVTSGHLYFSEITLKRHSPTGYDFTVWKITSHTDGQSDVIVRFDVSEAEEGVVYKVTSGNKVFKYRVNDDGTITVFLTENSEIEAEFKVMTFTARAVDDRTQIKDSAAGSNKFALVYTFEYGSTLDFLCNYTAIMRNGNKITGFTVSENADMTAVTETLGSGFDEENLSYPTASAIMKTTEEKYVCDVYVKAEIEAINYRVYYSIYSVADSLNHLSGAPVTVYGNAATQTTYTVNYNGTVGLIGDDETKVVAENAGLDVDNAMYSGWYKGDTLDSSKTEGDGFKDATGSYSAERTYRHETYASHAYFSCYLIRMITSDSGVAELNDTIKNTAEYKNYVGAYYRQIEMPAVGADGAAITALADEAFIGFYTITSVIMPETVTKIGARAFSGCSSLTGTGLVDAVEEIGEDAYYGCSALTEVTIGERVAKIGNRAFAEINNLATINYLSTATLSGLNPLNVGSQVFGNSGKDAAEGIAFIVGTGVTAIVKDLFCSRTSLGGYEENGKYLTSVSFASGDNAELVTIAGGAFAGSGLVRFDATERVTEIGESAFGYCASLEEADLSRTSLTIVGKKAFEYSGVKTVVLPEAVTEIGGYAFSGCEDLTSVYYSSDAGLSTIGERAFSKGDGGEAPKLVRITHVSEMAKEGGGEQVVRLENLVLMGMEAFYYCSSVKEAVIGGDATVLGASAFVGASSLAKLTYNVRNGANKDGAGSATFVQTNSTNCELIIGETVKTVPDYAFYGFTAVKTLTVPETVTKIGVQAFGMMSGLTLVNFNPDGAEYECTEAAKPFFGAGSAAGMKAVFGANVSSIRAGAFAGATNLTAIEIAAASVLSLIIGDRAFADTGITAVSLPERDGITVGESAFSGAPVTALTVDEGNETAVFKAGAFGSTTAPERMTVNMMGRVMSSMFAKIDSGAFTVTQTATGLKGTLVGTMTTFENIDFSVEKTDELELNGTSTVFVIKTGATIHGKLLSVGGATIEKSETAQYFKAVAYDKGDFIDKNAFGGYTHLKIAEGEAISFESSLTVNAVEFEVARAVEFLATTNLSVDRCIVNDGVKVKVNAASFRLSGALGGELAALAGAEIVIGSERFINNGNAPEDGYGKGIRVLSGETIVGSGESGYDYTVTSGEAEINYDYEQKTGYRLKISGGALTVSAVAVLSSYEAAAGTELTVAETGLVRLGEYSVGQGGALWTVDAAVSRLGSDVKNYYGTLSIAYGDASALESGATYLLGKSLSVGESVNAPSVATVLDFNGFTLTFNGGAITANEKLTLKNASVSATGETTTLSGTGEIVVESGTIETEYGAIGGSGKVTVNAGALVTSARGTAIETSADATINGTVTGYDFGLKVVGSAANVVITGAVEATGTNNSAVYAEGSAVVVTAESGATISGDVGIKSVRPTETTTDTATPLINVKSGATVAGQTAGILTVGAGYTSISGTVSATAARGITLVGDERIYRGAIVAVENGNDDGNYARVSISGTVTNADGDAVLYVGYGKADSFGAGYAAVTLEAAARITGAVAEYVTAYGTLSGSSYEGEVYALDGNGAMALYYGSAEAGSGTKYLYEGRTRMQTGYALTSDEPASNGDGATARYLSHYMNVTDAFGKGGIIRVNNATITELPEGETIVASGTATVASASAVEINGKIGISSGGKLSVETNAAINGRLIFFGGISEEEFEISTGVDVTVNAGGKVNIGAGMKISSGASVTIYGETVTTASSKIVNGGRLVLTADCSLKGEITGENGSVTAIGGNLTVDSFSLNGGTVESTVGKTLTATNMSFGAGNYEIAAGITAEYLYLGETGTNVTANGKVVIDGEITYGSTQGTTLTLAGEGNAIKSTGIGYSLNVSGTTNVTTPGEWSISGTVTVNAELKVDKGTGAVSVITGGRIVLAEGGNFTVNNVRLGAGGGLENNGGTLNADEMTVICSGGWMFTKDGCTAYVYTGEVAEAEEVAVNVYDGGVLKGRAVSNCEGEEIVVVAPTCGEIGYTGCKYEVKGVLSDGTPLVIKHDRQRILPATGEHTFAEDDGSGKHRCTVCGLYEEHVSEYVAAAYMDDNYFVDGKQIFILGEVCSVCNDRHTLLIIDCETTEREFNEMNLFLAPSAIGEEGKRISAQGDGDEPMGAKATGSVTVGGTLYYIVKVNVEANVDYYVLVAHSDCHYKPDENGTHTCIGCGQTEETPHVADTYATKKTENGAAVYGVVTKVCGVCGEGELLSVEATTVAEAITAVSAITVTLDGYEWKYSITAESSLGIGEAAAFTFAENGITYYALAVTLTRTDDEAITKEYTYEVGGESRTTGFILPVKNDSAHICTVVSEAKTVGGKTLNVIGAKCVVGGEGNAYFELSATPTVGELKGVLLGYLVEYNDAEYRITVKENYDGLALGELVKGYFVEETTGCDVVEVVLVNATTGITLAGSYYVAVKHVCHNFLHSGSAHVCADCRADYAAAHEETVTGTAKYTVGDNTYEFVINKCAICGTGTPVVLSSATAEDLNAELASVKMTAYAADKNGNGGYYELPARLAEDKGDLYKLYPVSIKLKPDGTFVDVGGDEEGTVYGITYVRFATDTLSHDGVYAMLFPHKCTDYKSNSDGSGHVCVECGAAYGEGDEEHSETLYGVQEMVYDNGTIKVLNKYCAFCGKGSAYTTTATRVYTVNSTLKTYTATIDGNTYSIAITDSKYTSAPYTTTPSASGKSVDVGGKTYYLWEITLTPKSSGTAITAYVLIGTN